MGYRQRKSPRKILHGTEKPFFSIFLIKHVLLRRRQETQTLDRGSRYPKRPIESVHDPAADLVFLQQELDRLRLVDCGLASTTAFRICGKRLAKLVRQP